MTEAEQRLIDVALLEAERRWIPVGERLPPKEPHRSILMHYKDATGRGFMALCSSLIVGSVKATHWKEIDAPPEDK